MPRQPDPQVVIEGRLQRDVHFPHGLEGRSTGISGLAQATFLLKKTRRIRQLSSGSGPERLRFVRPDSFAINHRRAWRQQEALNCGAYRTGR